MSAAPIVSSGTPSGKDTAGISVPQPAALAASAWPGDMRIGIAGAGAIGCTLAVLLARVGAAVHVLARGASLARIRQDGLVLWRKGECMRASVAVADDAAELGVQDVLFLCAKSQDVAALLGAAQAMVDRNTTVIPLVNGVPWWFFQGMPGPWAGQPVQSVDPGGALLQAVPLHQLLGAVVFITAERRGPAEVVSDNPLLMVLGHPASGMPGTRLRQIAALLEAAGIQARGSDSIRDTLWTKLLANLTSNPLSVVSGATLAQIYGDPRLLPVVRQMLQEGLALAAAHGARIAFAPASFLAEGAAMGAVRTSMLQDYLAGRPLELAAIGDAVLELAALQGMDMPVTRRVIDLAHFRDAARAGAAPVSPVSPDSAVPTKECSS